MFIFMKVGNKMEIKMFTLSELKPYKNNARKNDEAVKYVAESIKQFGFKVPIVIDKDNVIVAGHTRFKAAKKLNINEVPCIIADDLSEEQIKAFRLADNKTAEQAEWDFDLLTEELEDIFDIDMQDFGFTMDIDEDIEIQEDDFSAAIPEEPKSKLGDIYQLGRHRLMCGSSTDINDVEKLINGGEVNFINCDPPYGMNAVTKSGVLSAKYDSDIMNDDNNEVAIDSFNLCISNWSNVKQIWWGANYYTECLPSAECWIVWDKNNGASDQTDCELAWTNFRSAVRQFTLASEKTNRVHPTQKPCKLLQQIFNKFDKNNDFNRVVDLFGGSGFTLMTCEQMDKTCYTMELDPKYVDVIINRWEQFTGEKAVLLNG